MFNSSSSYYYYKEITYIYILHRSHPPYCTHNSLVACDAHCPTPLISLDVHRSLLLHPPFTVNSQQSTCITAQRRLDARWQTFPQFRRPSSLCHCFCWAHGPHVHHSHLSTGANRKCALCRNSLWIFSVLRLLYHLLRAPARSMEKLHIQHIHNKIEHETGDLIWRPIASSHLMKLMIWQMSLKIKNYYCQVNKSEGQFSHLD